MVASKYKFRAGRVSLPSSQPLAGIPAIQINDFSIPQTFSIVFYPSRSTPAQRKEGAWTLELKIFVTEEGVPNAFDISIRQRDHELESEISRTPRPLKRWQLELVENEFHNLLAQSMMACIETFGPLGDGVWGRYKWISEGEVDGVEHGYLEIDPDLNSASEVDSQPLSEREMKTLDRTVQRLTHRRTQDRKHLKRVASIYNEELKRAQATGTRARMTKEVMNQMGTPEGTARLWIKNARNADLLLSLDSKMGAASKKVGRKVKASNTKGRGTAK